MSTTYTLTRKEHMAKKICVKPIHLVNEEEGVLQGPYDSVQMTYGSIRGIDVAGRDTQLFAFGLGDLWWGDPSGPNSNEDGWTDILIFEDAPKTTARVCPSCGRGIKVEYDRFVNHSRGNHACPGSGEVVR